MILPLYFQVLIQQIPLTPVSELPKLQQSPTDLKTSKSICEIWQLEDSYELQHQRACIQNCTLLYTFGKTYYQSVLCSCLERFHCKQILRGYFSGSFLTLPFILAKRKDSFYMK